MHVLPKPAEQGQPVEREATAETVVVTDHLTKRYGSRTVVDGLSFKVHRGEVYGFLGPNGAGKTTTLRMLVGLVRPTSGSATLLGQPAGAAAARVGSLIEGPGFYPYLSGRDNLRVLAKYAGVRTARVEIVLDTVDLQDRADDRYSKYSLGMKQRLGVAAALLKDPKLVLLDEPTNGLDPSGITDMRALLRRLAADGRTVVLSSHLLSEVQQVCDRIAVISRGRLVAESTVDDLLGLSRLVIAADPLTDAADIAAGLLGPDRVDVVDGSLHLQAEPEDTARINRALVQAGIDVTELRHVVRTLEEAFLEITGSDMSPDQPSERQSLGPSERKSGSVWRRKRVSR
jgi:ABC-2 type transport system ATP-binding protein